MGSQESIQKWQRYLNWWGYNMTHDEYAKIIELVKGHKNVVIHNIQKTQILYMSNNLGYAVQRKTLMIGLENLVNKLSIEGFNMSKTIWMLQNEESSLCYESSHRIVTERFWFNKPSIKQLTSLGFSKERALILFNLGEVKNRYESWFLREKKEGELCS